MEKNIRTCLRQRKLNIIDAFLGYPENL
ncbi:hypothetical protein FRAAL6722 [Frankia alni ACN14a]|uniref:Uncharacterized protein n=1 Tax=Frankia alni (strain DSM 45986 / CECT 9034 / ACN14a) TaxID=326424 RepID=Q0RB43_FRAAA|nr:hypothetical protein FRAAL6722 [Frankia alni ACN14a]